MSSITVTLFSNFLNHHQLPFCLEMQKRLGNQFKFVATECIPKERLDLGYDDMNKSYDFVVRSYEDENEAYRLGEESDIVIIGSASDQFISNRLKQKKLTFRYSERIFKDGFHIRDWLSIIKNYTFKERNVYLLCSSAYSACDYNLAGAYLNRCFKWGYFPNIQEYDINQLLARKRDNRVPQILWVGRFLDWKHPEKAIMIARKLKEEHYSFKMKMIGIGPLLETIRKQVKDYDLVEEVELLGSINNKKVRTYMEEANLFLFTSDYHEGWGAVLNESMNSGCTVIASHAIGSVPFLLNHQQNGFIYKDESIEDLYKIVKLVINDTNIQQNCGRNAYDTMINYWNAAYATEAFLKLCNAIIDNKKTVIDSNIPCAKANFIPQQKMYRSVVHTYDQKNNK